MRDDRGRKCRCLGIETLGPPGLDHRPGRPVGVPLVAPGRVRADARQGREPAGPAGPHHCGPPGDEGPGRAGVLAPGGVVPRAARAASGGHRAVASRRERGRVAPRPHGEQPRRGLRLPAYGPADLRTRPARQGRRPRHARRPRPGDGRADGPADRPSARCAAGVVGIAHPESHDGATEEGPARPRAGARQRAQQRARQGGRPNIRAAPGAAPGAAPWRTATSAGAPRVPRTGRPRLWRRRRAVRPRGRQCDE